MPCPLPRRIETGACVDCFPVSRGLPHSLGGSASALSFSRPAQASLALRPARSLDRPRRPLSRGFDGAGCPATPPVSYQLNRQLAGWNPPPQVIRAFEAHVESRKGAVAAGVGVAVAGGFRQVPVPQSTPWLRFLSPLIEPDVPISGIRLSDQLHYRPTADTSVVTDVRGGRVPVLRTHARWRTAPFRAL